MAKLDVALVTNMTTPYRAPFYEALATNPHVNSLCVYTCVARECDRQWDVKKAKGYQIKKLWGVTLNLAKGVDARRIVHIRFGIFEQLFRKRPSVVIIGDASWTSFLTVAACLVMGIKYVVWNEITTSSKINNGLVHKLRIWMYCHSNHIVAACTLAKNYLLSNRVHESRITIINNAVDNDYFLAQRSKKEHLRSSFRRGLGVMPSSYCYIYVGQLISRKRVVETVEYVAAQAKEKSCHLLVVGSGPLEDAMRAKANDIGLRNITFCGYASQERLCELYVASDCLILLSEDEPWGMVVNETLLFGKPYVATENVGAAVDLIAVNSNSILVGSESDERSEITTLALPSAKSMAARFVGVLTR
ncbi:glycosyltransferase [Teredinibacter turnerae]|uniref:glycosyltransferase n=1 Tax=Teredinibacter turnerae TaxID=2426 RepID=UPI0030CDC58C